MSELFQTLSTAVQAGSLVALGAAFVWGLLSLVLSPCHLASIPLVVGFIDVQGRGPVRRSLLLSTLFALGIFVTIGVVGAATALAGRMLGDIGSWGNFVVAAVFVLMGLHLIGAVELPFRGISHVGMRRRGPWAALVLGLVFGLALGPCTFAFMAPVLAVTFSSAESGVWAAALLLVAYGVGHCLIIVLAGTFTGALQNYLDWNERSRGGEVPKKVCGALIIVAGLYMLYLGLG
jgi:cytochrome c-type biogenesis protein